MTTTTDPPARSARTLGLCDTGLATLVTLWVWTTAELATEPGTEKHSLAGWALGLLLGPLQLARRRRPVTVLLASAAVVVLYHVAGYPAVGLEWPLIVPYFGAAAAGYLRYAVPLALGLSAAAVAWRATLENEWLLGVLLDEAQSLVIVGLALGIGEAAWQRHRWAGEVRQRLRRVEEDARLETERRLTQQRLAIAADLHDVAAHGMVVIGLQLRLAQETLETEPAACREALTEALTAHDEALREATRTVALLRAGDESDPSAPREPLPAMDDLARLGDVAAQAGLTLQVHIDEGESEGEESDERADELNQRVPASIALVAYRICQEALTNTLKHAEQARRAELHVSHDGSRLHLRFTDDGRPAAAPASPSASASASGSASASASGNAAEHGIAGMRERAESLGGHLTAGPGPHGGFRVEAWLPTEVSATREGPHEHQRPTGR